MNYIATLILSFIVIGVVVWVLSRVRTPRYRLRRENIIALFERILDGKATVHDWNIFVSMPIRYDPELEAVRRRCMILEEQHFLGNSSGQRGGRYLFTEEGLKQLRAMLKELQNKNF